MSRECDSSSSQAGLPTAHLLEAHVLDLPRADGQAEGGRDANGGRAEQHVAPDGIRHLRARIKAGQQEG